MIAHAARLRGTAGRRCLGIEVDHDRPATEVRELDRAAILIGKLEVGGEVSLADHARSVASRRPARLAYRYETFRFDIMLDQSDAKRARKGRDDADHEAD